MMLFRMHSLSIRVQYQINDFSVASDIVFTELYIKEYHNQHMVRYQIRTIPNLLIRVFFVKKNLSVEEARPSILDGVSRLVGSTDLV